MESGEEKIELGGQTPRDKADRRKIFTLRKRDKLRHRILVERLFSQGESIYEYPMRVVWRVVGRDELTSAFRCGMPHGIGRFQFMVTVPKKRRRHAVDRVLMRRRIRESLRLNRLPLMKKIEENPEIGSLEMVIVYVSDKNEDYAKVERKMVSLLGKIAARLASDEKDMDKEGEKS